MICFRSITKSVARFAFYAMNTVVGEIVGAFRARSFAERNSLHRKTSRLRFRPPHWRGLRSLFMMGVEFKSFSYGPAVCPPES